MAFRRRQALTAPRKDAGLPTVDDIRFEILKLAGYTRDDMARLAKKAITTLETCCDAEIEQTFSYMGQQGDTVKRPDYATRHKAAEALLKFTDAVPKKDEGASKGPSIVYIAPNIYPEGQESATIIDHESSFETKTGHS